MTEGPPEGKEHHKPELYYDGVLKGARLVAEKCTKDIIFPLKAVMLSFVMRDTSTLIIYCLLYESFFFLCGRLVYMNPESWLVVGFCPQVESTGCSGHT